MNKNDLWNIINRFDHYISVTNSKATLVIAFNTFIISAMVMKSSEILKNYSNKTISSIISIIVLIICLSALTSLFFTFKAINPFLKSPKRTSEYHSHIYFDHIVEFNNEDSFYDSCKKNNDCDINKDLSYQIFILAKGMSEKFKNVTISYGIVIYCIIPLLIFSLILLVIDKLIPLSI